MHEIFETKGVLLNYLSVQVNVIHPSVHTRNGKKPDQAAVMYN